MILQMDLKGNFLQCRRFHTACHPKAASLRQLDAATEEYFVSWTRTLTHPNTAWSDLTSILDASLMRRIHICIFIKLELRDLIFCRLSILGSSIYKRLKTPHYNKISHQYMHIIIRNENRAFIHKYMHKNKQNLSMNKLNHYNNTSLKTQVYMGCNFSQPYIYLQLNSFPSPQFSFAHPTWCCCSWIACTFLNDLNNPL